jgi:hypothetical protein
VAPSIVPSRLLVLFYHAPYVVQERHGRSVGDGQLLPGPTITRDPFFFFLAVGSALWLDAVSHIRFQLFK